MNTTGDELEDTANLGESSLEEPSSRNLGESSLEEPSSSAASSSGKKPAKKFTFTFKRTSDETTAASNLEHVDCSKVARIERVEVTTDTLHLLPQTSTPTKMSQNVEEHDLTTGSNTTMAATIDDDIAEMSPIFKSYRSSRLRTTPLKMKSLSDADDELCCNTFCCSCKD